MKYLHSGGGGLIIALFTLLAVQVAIAELPSPYFVFHVAADDTGNIYALASGNESISNNIHVYAPDGGEIKTIDARGRSVDETAFDGEGNLYLRDTSYDNSPAQSIRKIDRSGNETIIDSVNRSDNVVLLGLAVGSDGTVYYGRRTEPGQYSADNIQSLQDYRILKVSPDGDRSVAFSINGSSGFVDLAVDASGTIYASDAITVTAISPDGNVSVIKRIGPQDSPVNLFGSVSIGPEGRLYTAEYSSAIGAGRVRMLDTNGTTIAQWTGCGPYRFVTATSVAVDQAGRIYVADLHNQRIVWLTEDYRFGDDEGRNLEGNGVLWGTVVQGYDYGTWGAMANQEANPGLPYPVIGTALASIIAVSIIAVLLIKFYWPGKS